LAKSKYDIIFENENFVAVNKPSGMLAIPDREQSEKSLKEFLQEKYGNIYVVHRLDKDTSGLIVYAKNEITHKYLCKIFEERLVRKFYVGLVLGSPNPYEDIIELPIAEHGTNKGLMVVHRNGKESKTGYKVLEASPQISLVSFELFTGRTHQIRVHAKEIGHPLICDTLYGDGKAIYLSAFIKNYKLSKKEDEEKAIVDRLGLHAHQLFFTDEYGKHISLEAPIPKTFTVLLKQLKKL
jgi:23S rRNA pseudouridine1911/1915/1917 synthase